MLKDPSLLQKSKHVTRNFTRQLQFCRHRTVRLKFHLSVQPSLSLSLSVFVSGKQCSTDSEGICCKHQHGYHLMEQCPRSHRIQTGLGTHPRWFQIFHTWHHTVHLVQISNSSNSKSKRHLLYCMCVFFLILPSHYSNDRLSLSRAFVRLWHVTRGLFVMLALQENQNRMLFLELILCNAFRVCWSGPSQAAGPKRQHHRVPSEECSPWYRVCPHSLCAVWICGGAWYHSYLQNM